ncbi:MAG: 3-phosphoserine/phosphohydroxythreonine transaminase [Polyangiales bacterium]
MTQRPLNFSPGPATLPLAALEAAQRELLDVAGSGISILEHSHRGPQYAEVHAQAKALLRHLLDLPESHEVLFLQGGASLQFAMVPLNFLPAGRSADYVVTGTWSEKAVAEAKLIGDVNIAADTKDNGAYIRVPTPTELVRREDAAYLHLTSNNTIMGTQFHRFPAAGAVPMVADMSSDLLWRPFDVRGFGLIYAGAQKNLGSAGVTVVIAERDFIARACQSIPKILRYDTFLKSDSLQNTPPTFAIYLLRNVLSWMEAEGGLSAMQARNQKKAELLYGTVDALAGFYRCPVEKSSRSVMNAVFRLPSEALEAQFLASAKEVGMVGLKGHRSVGGIRVSMYNAMGPEGIETLTAFMREFARTHG